MTPEFQLNRIALDSGVFYSGRLSCLVLKAGERRLLHTKVYAFDRFPAE